MRKYSVFISSVYTEFIDERREVINAILQNGDLPICMEMFNSRAGRSTDILRRYIADCDYFVLLIGDKYGDIEPQSQVSYTEYEYNIAIELGLKPIVFLKRSINRTEETKTLTRYRYIYEILSLPVLKEPVTKEEFLKEINMTVPEFAGLEEYKLEVTYNFKYRKR